MPTPTEYEAQHLKNIAQLSGKIKELYFKQIEAIFRKATGLKLTEGQIYDLKNFPSFSKALDEAMAKMSADMRAMIVNSMEDGWNLANVKNDSFVNSVVGDVNLPEKVYERFFDRSLPAMREFINRKEAGLNLSDRVWSKTAQFRQEVETQLFEGITEGKAATRMATELKTNLNDPDKLFRRVRDKYGELKLSKPAKEYHPGQGRYRSSYQNALRLAGTETNMAYRTADHERWKRINFVLGFEVKLSGNHPVPDICDDAKGKYPKEFHFRGWHPRCRCYAVPIRPDEETMGEYIDHIMDGGDPAEFNFTGQVEQVPNGLTNYLKENKQRIDGYKNKPYYLRDNKGMLKRVTG